VLDYVESKVVFGRVSLCLLDDNGFGGLVVVVCKPSARCDIGAYVVTDTDGSVFHCVLLDDLLDYCPLPSYNINGVPYVALKHTPFDSCGMTE